MITVITPTGDRPEAFDLLRKWMGNQIIRPDQWIVVDDGKVPLQFTESFEYLRRDPRIDDPEFTLSLNLQKSIPDIKGDKILIMEDDEYYAPQYIEEMSHRLDDHEVVGINNGRYYHLPSGGYIQRRWMAQASLAQTGFRRSFLTDFVKCIDGDTYIDTRIWRKAKGHLFDDENNKLYLGMKGLPGRMGIGYGHRDFSRFHQDSPDHKVLRQWCTDADIYLELKGTINV